MRKKKIYHTVILHLILGILAVIVLIPIYYLIVTTFKSGTEAALHPMSLPEAWSFDGYMQAFQDMQYPRAFGILCLLRRFPWLGFYSALPCADMF